MQRRKQIILAVLTVLSTDILVKGYHQNKFNKERYKSEFEIEQIKVNVAFFHKDKVQVFVQIVILKNAYVHAIAMNIHGHHINDLILSKNGR